MSCDQALTIISGGQTGADRAALDFAIAHGLPHGGWCPRGRRAEDGVIDERYKLRETDAANYAVRTRENILEADGTVVFSSHHQTQGGTALTLKLAQQLGSPCLHLVSTESKDAAGELQRFITRHNIRRLNVAGPRASQDSQIGEYVYKTLEVALTTGVDSQLPELCAPPNSQRPGRG